MRILDIGARFNNPVAEALVTLGPNEVVIPNTISDALGALDEIDLVCFGGGADISPALYGHKNVASGTERYDSLPSFRDIFEQTVFQACKVNAIPVLGVCRGAQMLCALNGGFLLQDVNGHLGSHLLHLKDVGLSNITMTSTHHQLMQPQKTHHELLAWTESKISRYEWDRNKVRTVEVKKEPEIVYFPDTNSLAIQGHPEYYPENHPTTKFVCELVHSKLLMRNK